MAQYGAIYACRESFVPFSPPRTQAGRTLYRTPGRNGASHNSTPRTTGMKGTRGITGTRRGRAGDANTTARQIPHAIPNQPNPTSTQNPHDSNDHESQHETPARELHAKLLGRRGQAGRRNNTPHHTSATRNRRCEGRRRDLPRCRCAAAGPGRAPRRGTERSSRRGRRAGGPPHTGTHSGRARQRPQHQRYHKQHSTGGAGPQARAP